MDDARDDTTALPIVPIAVGGKRLPAMYEPDEPERDQPDEPGGDRPDGRARRRKMLLGAAVVLVVAAVGGGVAYTWLHDRPAPEPPRGPGAAPEVAVVKADLSERKTVPGTLGYGETTTVKGLRPGTVTWLPKAGDTAERGRPLARVDDRPVTVFYGDMPLYRKLGQLPEQPPRKTSEPTPSQKPGKSGSGGTDKPSPAPGNTPGTVNDTTAAATAEGTEAGGVAGPGTRGADVRILEENLYALGYRDFGRPDDVLTEATVTAIKRWQKANGDQHPSGVVAPSDVHILQGRARVGEVKAHVGDRADGDLLTLTGGTRSVTLPLAVSDKPLAPKGAKVTVDLPGGGKSTGTVRDVGTVAAQDGKDDSGGRGGAGAGGPAGDAKIKVTIALDDPGAARDLDGAPVSVTLTSRARDGVLAVPVGALVALREGGYAVEITGRGPGKPHLTSVKTGMFAQGLVEVSGPEIKEGVRVVTAQ
ncbi:peptidoglycan-binding protein [Streptomyces luteireticuli]|uniref:peptidoglycan-binding protein n=1 Tax=Streptomyces luteireticuli TaxID=173858 RepID=UPI0035583B90